MSSEIDLPNELKSLVHWSVDVLGHAIRLHAGEKIYHIVENLRLRMKDLRGSEPTHNFSVLEEAFAQLQILPSHDLFAIAHSFGFMLELMNACENAYRTVQIQRKPLTGTTQKNRSLIFVLTAHPTEARSSQSLFVFDRIEQALINALLHGHDTARPALDYWINLGWQTALAKQHMPRVEDEAEHVYSLLFKSDVFRAFLKASRSQAPLSVRTWVGGDKDGHPGVDEKVMLRSLSLSRKYIVALLQENCSQIVADLALLNLTRDISIRTKRLQRKFVAFKKRLARVARVKAGDGTLVLKIHEELNSLLDCYEKIVPALGSPTLCLRAIVAAFPGLVVPIELRESSDVIRDTVESKSNTSIRRMLGTLSRVAGRGEILWYAKCFVLSMVHSSKDVLAAAKISHAELGGLYLPLVPLFENANALENASSILCEILDQPAIAAAVKKYWSNRFEVMLGYSDSSKESGAFPSRLLIANALTKSSTQIVNKGFEPIFFHGSGGSVERGGGSIQDQTEWWPEEAFHVYKATIQGESIQRIFATPEVLTRQIERIAQHEVKPQTTLSASSEQALLEFASSIKQVYRAQIHTPEFLRVIEKSTPYRFVSQLKIGSRPTARLKTVSIESLRAIPWILCWTQTRVLFPTWWGVGSYWQKASATQKESLRRAYQESGLLRSYIKQLGFTLAKIEMPIWKMYLTHSKLASDVANEMLIQFEQEFAAAKECVRFISEENDLVWFRPWLQQSLYLRSAMIHPLNLIQLIALRSNDERLLRETVTGIASGMFATG